MGHVHVLMKEGRSKQGQTNNNFKAKQHSRPKAVTFPKANELLGGTQTHDTCTCTCTVHVHACSK